MSDVVTWQPECQHIGTDIEYSFPTPLPVLKYVWKSRLWIKSSSRTPVRFSVPPPVHCHWIWVQGHPRILECTDSETRTFDTIPIPWYSPLPTTRDGSSLYFECLKLSRSRLPGPDESTIYLTQLTSSSEHYAHLNSDNQQRDYYSINWVKRSERHRIK